MQYFLKAFILLPILIFYYPLQGKEGLEGSTGKSYTSSHPNEFESPFLRHTEGCRSIGILLNIMPAGQVLYGIYYHIHVTQSIALRFSGGISSVKFGYKKHIRWGIIPSCFCTFFSAHDNHYISLSLGPVIEYGPYRPTTFGLPNKNGWDIRIMLVPQYTFYFKKHWSFCIGIGPCIGFLKDRGKSGLLGSGCLQYNL